MSGKIRTERMVGFVGGVKLSAAAARGPVNEKTRVGNLNIPPVAAAVLTSKTKPVQLE